MNRTQTLPRDPLPRNWGRLHPVEPEQVGGLVEDREGRYGTPMPHPFAVVSWAVRETRSGVVRVRWSNSGGREQVAS